MIDTVMFNLQAAVMTTAAGAGAELADIPDDALSFSDILTQTAGGTGQAEEAVRTDNSEAAENTEVQTENAADSEDGDVPDTAFKFETDGIAKLIEKSESGVKKALRMLLKAVVKAICGNGDGRERKTDLFSVLGGNAAGFSDEAGGDMDMLLMGAEIMDRMGAALEFGLNSEDTDADGVIAELDKLVKKIFADVEDDEDIDENTAAEIAAALLHIPMNDGKLFAPEEEKVEAAESAVTALKAPKEEAREIVPEKIPETERLVDEFKVEIESVRYVPKTETASSARDEVNDARSVMQMNGFAAKINDAEAQVRAISGEPAAEEIAEEADADSENDAETASIAAAVNAEPQPLKTETAEVKIEPEEIRTARSVEEQLTEAITEKSFEIKEDNGTEELIMVLKPENLGQVAVKLVKENGAVSVMLSAQYDEVGKMMTERAASLGGSLSDNHVEVKSVEVVNPSSAAEQMGLTFTNQGFSFAQNFSRGQDRSTERRGGYDGAGVIGGADIIEATDNIELIREARLWTTA